jgi:Tfp pilus assembly protein PilX
MTSIKMQSNLPAGQAGIILPIALIVLVAMTLSALSLIRAVNMTTLVAGNLAFRESAVLSAERSTEAALRWLVEHSVEGDVTLNDNSAADGYRAKRVDPDDQNWGAFWENTLEAQAKSGGTDVAGNRVSYVIHRLCDDEGVPDVESNNCSKPPINTSGDSKVGDFEGTRKDQIYYRITTQVAGPRYTVVYTQTIIAI